ncbi:MAG: hypothetical protein JWN72_997 [Thermoleophilia bacterium]|nr:hypothetical protein [Thermoleophilia bacterium]
MLRRRGSLGYAALLAMVAMLAAGCGDRSAEPTRPGHQLLTVPTDAQGDPIVPKAEKPPRAPFVADQLETYRRRSSLEAWRTRIDVGGDKTLRAFATAPEAGFLRLRPDYSIRLDPSRFGTDFSGICLGEDELAISGKQSYIEIQHCRANNLNLWVPIARGVWLVVGDRAAVRADVVDYVHQLFATAPAAAARVGRSPLGDAALDRSRTRFDAFVADAHARGIEQVEG